MIGVGFGTDAPVDVIVFWWVVSGFVALVTITETPATATFATTIVIRDDIAFAIRRILTGTDPGNRRGLRTGWALGYGATTTAAEKSVNSAVAPIVTTLRVAHFREVEF